MRRREFLGFVGGAAAWPVAARAQQPKLPVIGLLGNNTAEGYAPRMAAFMQGLKETGFVVGENVTIEYRWANNQYERLPAMAADLVRTRVALIAALGNNLPARAAKSATSEIPIVFAMGADPVRLGVVASLNRPGGNITGVIGLAGDLMQKRLQLLHDLIPHGKVFGLLDNPNNNPAYFSGRTELELAQEAARIWGGTIEVAHVQTIDDFDGAFAALAKKRIDALATAGEAIFGSGRERLVELAAQYAMPAVFHTKEISKAGGLMSYGSIIMDTMRHAGLYAGRILKGEKPADLPVLLPTKFEFVINLRTAKTLGLTIPPGLLAIADEVIE
jgi:putative ABC transport system substrate-binding protein